VAACAWVNPTTTTTASMRSFSRVAPVSTAELSRTPKLSAAVSTSTTAAAVPSM
jgi:hypothetical protein